MPEANDISKVTQIVIVSDGAQILPSINLMP